jgi:hypothetical protein
LSDDKLATLVAQGDIGQNDLTDVSKVYALGSVAVAGIDGFLLLQEEWRSFGDSKAEILQLVDRTFI